MTEFVGTFFLVLIIGLSADSGEVAAPLAIGLGLTALVKMGGHITGAHYNPAVTFGFLLVGAIDRRDLLPYVIAQLLAAVSASTVLQTLSGVPFAPSPGAGSSLTSTLTAETLFTFLLMLVILNVAMARATRGNAYFGIAIGCTVTAGIFTVGGVSGAAFNPAVALGPMFVEYLVTGSSMSNAWMYVIAPTAGAAAAVPVFLAQESTQAGPED